MTQPSTRPPTFVAFCSQPGRPAESYVRYLVNSLREAFDLPGDADPLQPAQGRKPLRQAAVKGADLAAARRYVSAISRRCSSTSCNFTYSIADSMSRRTIASCSER